MTQAHARLHARALFSALLVFFALAPHAALAGAAGGKKSVDIRVLNDGLAIAREARARQLGFGNFTAKQTMVLRNKQGRESKRQLRVKVLEVEGDGDKSVFVFDQPRDVKGTALLIHAHKREADEQWLFLPALKRVKRISSSNRSGSFMGSEFSYEDLGAQEVEKYRHRYLRDEPCGALQCAVSERLPTDAKSGYKRQLVWHDRDELRLWKVEYYDRKDERLKTLTMENYGKYLGKYWHAGKMTMQNHRNGKGTVMLWSDYRFRTALDENDFTQTGLKRAR